MKRQKTEIRIKESEFRSQNSEVRILYSVFCILYSALCLLSFVTGCEDVSSGQTALAEQVDKLNLQNSQLQKQIEQAKAENEKLRERLHVLSGLPEKVKGENLYNLQSVRIGRYTDLYGDDKDGQKEKLIVYIQPIDEDGDIIKVAGAVDVQLWDLGKKEGQALLSEWHVGPEQLKKLWFATLMTHYKLTFDVADKISEFKDPLTVKVTFTDYLTGKIFKEQKVIEP